MTIEDYIRLASALVFVLALMGIFGLVLRRMNRMQNGFLGRNDRLSVVEQRMIDSRHKMVLIRRDDTEHLILLSQNGDSVIETGITPPKTIDKPRNKKDIPLEI